MDWKHHCNEQHKKFHDGVNEVFIKFVIYPMHIVLQSGKILLIADLVTYYLNLFQASY